MHFSGKSIRRNMEIKLQKNSIHHSAVQKIDREIFGVSASLSLLLYSGNYQNWYRNPIPVII